MHDSCIALYIKVFQKRDDYHEDCIMKHQYTT